MCFYAASFVWMGPSLKRNVKWFYIRHYVGLENVICLHCSVKRKNSQGYFNETGNGRCKTVEISNKKI